MIMRKPISVDRCPISVTRTPITIARQPLVIRTPINTGEPLDWNTIYNNLVNYIKFAAKQVAMQYNTGVVNSAEDLFQEGQLLLYHCYELYKFKPENQFNALFKASLWRKLRGIGSKHEFIQVDITESYDLGYNDEVVNDMYEEYKLQQVVELLGDNDIALTIIKELINPSDRTLWEAQMDMARKQTLKDQNYNIAVPQSVTIKGVHIQRGLEITKSSFKEAMGVVKDVVSKVFHKDMDDEDLEDVLTA